MVEPRRRRLGSRVLLGAGSAAALAIAYLVGKRLPDSHERNTRGVAAIGWAFMLSFGASVTLAVVYALGGQPQIEGAMLFVALGGLSVGLLLWAHLLMP